MPHPLLAALPAHPGMPEAAVFMTNGFFIVIGALLVLSIVINIISLMFMHGQKAALKRLDAQSAARSVASPAAASTATPSAPSPSAAPAASRAPLASPAPAAPVAVPSAAPLPEHIAAILVAAVHAALEGQAHRILHIEPSSGGWAREGRREIFSSHRFR